MQACAALERVDGLLSLVEAGYLYGCEAWRPAKGSFVEARSACLARLRTVARLWRRISLAESVAARNYRTLLALRKLLGRMGKEPAYFSWLRRYHRSAGKAVRIVWDEEPSPTQHLLRYRCREWLATYKLGVRARSGRTEEIGHPTFCGSW